VPTKITAAHALAPRQRLSMNGETVMTGSFNSMKAAQENPAESMLIIANEGLATQDTHN
jgi:hypothetical protein